MNASPTAKIGSPQDIVPALLGLLYLAAAVLIGDQLADLLATLLTGDMAPSSAVWRFGAVGLLTTRMSVFVLADVMLFIAALGLQHRGVVRVLGFIHLVLAAVLLAALVVFSLDWLQVRGSRVQAAGRHTFDLAALRAAGMMGFTALVGGWAGILALRVTRRRKGSGRREPDAPILADRRANEAGL